MIKAKLWHLSVAALLIASAIPARAAECYDVFGCTDRDKFRFTDLMSGPNCDFLYQMLNQIYRTHGFCYQSPRAIKEIGNDGCHVSDMTQVQLNPIEKTNVAVIAQAFRAKSCPP